MEHEESHEEWTQSITPAAVMATNGVCPVWNLSFVIICTGHQPSGAVICTRISVKWVPMGSIWNSTTATAEVMQAETATWGITWSVHKAKPRINLCDVFSFQTISEQSCTTVDEEQCQEVTDQVRFLLRIWWMRMKNGFSDEMIILRSMIRFFQFFFLFSFGW